jgi:hypothetical protein
MTFPPLIRRRTPSRIVRCSHGLAAIAAVGVVIALVGPMLSAGEPKAGHTVVGVLFGDVIVSANGGVDANLTAVDMRHRDPRKSARAAYNAYQPDYLDGHPQRLAACFNRIWQMKTSHFAFLANLSGGTPSWVDSGPGMAVNMKLDGAVPAPDDFVAQNLGGPAVGDVVAKAVPNLEATIDASKNDRAKKPVLYYDFAIRRLCHLTPTLSPPQNTCVEGVFFVQHRFEPRPFIIAVRFPVSDLRDQVPESFGVPFCEPFYCAVDQIANYYFVTESGAMISVPLPPTKAPREPKPLLAETGWKARVLLRDAKSGWSTVFAQRRVAGQPDKAVILPLIAHVPQRELPADFFSGDAEKSDQVLLWKCADALRGNK